MGKRLSRCQWLQEFLLGGLIKWLVSRRFYVKAARDLTA
jgi:hypothetical protein